MPDQSGKTALYFYQFDYLLLAFILAATVFGLIVLDGSTYQVAGLSDLVHQQMRWAAIALAVFALAAAMPYRWLLVLGWPFYLACLVLLLALLVASRFPQLSFLTAVKSYGATSWYRFQLGSMSVRFQPSEFTKIAVVIVLAQWLAWRGERVRHLHECLAPLVVAYIPMAVVLKQPDFGTASIFLPLPLVLLFVAGLPWRTILVSVLLAVVLSGGAAFYLATAESVPGLRKYQLQRIHSFLTPLVQPFQPPGIEDVLQRRREPEGRSERAPKITADQWQIRQAEMALGSGRLTGKGWRQGTQSRLRFLPKHYNDFIFCSLGEQFGFVGCVALIGLYILIVWRALTIAALASDPFGKYMVVGLLTIFVVHVFINIGISVRLLPVTGLPLPFMSHGGSFLVVNFLIFGLIANVGMRRGVSGVRDMRVRMTRPRPSARQLDLFD